ncbi:MULTISPECIES: hypothetical protein [Enterobacter]|nr:MULTISPECIES: hypothetical protein [Enterobacter]
MSPSTRRGVNAVAARRSRSSWWKCHSPVAVSVMHDSRFRGRQS